MYSVTFHPVVLLFISPTSAVCLLSCPYADKKWDCLFILVPYESWGSISANIFLKLFHFALKNATISILQTYSILWPAALLYNSHSLGKVCIATAEKKRKIFAYKIQRWDCTDQCCIMKQGKSVCTIIWWMMLSAAVLSSETPQRANWDCGSRQRVLN